MGDKPNPPKPQTLHLAYTVTNIKNMIPPLDGTDVTYPTWVKLFKLHAVGYDVLNHIDGSPTPDKTSADYPSWKKIDAVVLQWIYGTLNKEFLVRVLEDESTTFEAWKRVKNLFLNNKGPRAASLQHELTNITLTSMPSLEACCQRIRELVDQLTAVDCPVNNTQRILHLVNGLPREYDTTASILNQTLPPWEEAVERLQSDARRIAARDKLTPTPPVAATDTPVIAAAMSNNSSRENPTNNHSAQPNNRNRSNRNTNRPNRNA
ncbi:uncharacterized protein LOC110919675 [Helianthus annuus]|uniref:uncharacterized protein LOC110919675 n=1 Tax=Helianthus annuus TaxID=4232 RepID=UPI000B8FB4AE|nr:uncharacterized protein LOC110919675 [Helianthus annuus]